MEELVYLDGLIVFSGSRSAHVVHVAEVLTLLGNAGLSLKLKKCYLFSEIIDYLRHVIRPCEVIAGYPRGGTVRRLY
jgi:hypothetical protein